MCHHELWPTSVSHPFSSLNSSLGFAGGKHYQKITILIFRLVVQNFAIPGCFPYIFFSMAIFSPYFLLVGLLLQSVALFQSLSLKKFMEMSLNFIWRCLFEPCYCCMQYLTVIAAHNCYQIEAAWHWARSGAQTIMCSQFYPNSTQKTSGRNIGCLLWIQIYILPQLPHWCVQYPVILALYMDIELNIDSHNDLVQWCHMASPLTGACWSSHKIYNGNICTAVINTDFANKVRHQATA